MLLEEGALQAYREKRKIVSCDGNSYSGRKGGGLYYLGSATGEELLGQWTIIEENINEKLLQKVKDILNLNADFTWEQFQDYILNKIKIEEIK